MTLIYLIKEHYTLFSSLVHHSPEMGQARTNTAVHKKGNTSIY